MKKPLFNMMIFLLMFMNFLYTSTQNQQATLLQFNHKITQTFNENQQKQYKLPILDNKEHKSTEQSLYFIARLSEPQSTNLFYQPRITVISPKSGKPILICNQIANKFYQICSISIKTIFQIENRPVIQNLKIKIMSLAQNAKIQIEVYLGTEYKMNIGQEVFLEADEYKDKQIQTQQIILSVPKDLITKYQKVYFYLFDEGSSPYFSNNQSQGQKKLAIKYKKPSTNKNLKNQKEKSSQIIQAKVVSSNNDLISQILTSQLQAVQNIKVQIIYNDQFSRLRFYTAFEEILTIKKTQKTPQKIISNKIGQINNYYDFNIPQGGTYFIKFDNMDEFLKLKQNQKQDEVLELAVYAYTGEIKYLKVVNQANNNVLVNYNSSQEHELKQNSTSYQSQKIPTSFFLFPIKKSSFDYSALKKGQKVSLYLQMKAQKLFSQQLCTFYVSLRQKQLDSSLEQGWPQIIDSLLTQRQNGVNFIFQDFSKIDPKTLSMNKGKQKYSIEINDLVNYQEKLLYKKQKNIDILGDQIKLMITRCTSLQVNGTIDCLNEAVSNSKQVSDNLPLPITVEHVQYNKFSSKVTFEYNLALCPITTFSQNFLIRKCIFKLTFYRTKTNKTTSPSLSNPFSFTFQKQPSLLPLSLTPQKHHTFQYRLSPRQQLYFSFSIPLSSQIQSQLSSMGIYQSIFQLTTYYGDCVLIGSKTQKYPAYTLSYDKTRDFEFSVNGRLKVQNLTEHQLENNVYVYNYYVSVYCYAESAFDLNFLTKLTNNPKQAYFYNMIKLQNNFPKKISIQGNEIAVFVIDEMRSTDFLLQINQLKGNVQYDIYYGSQNQTQTDYNKIKKVGTIPCENSLSGSKSCLFSYKNTQPIYIQVYRTSYSNQIAQFTISLNNKIVYQQSNFQYNNQMKGSCEIYPFNTPNFVQLSFQQSSCTDVRLIKYDDVQVSFTASHFQFIFSDIQIQISINGIVRKYGKLTDNMINYFSKDKIKQYCCSQELQTTNQEDTNSSKKEVNQFSQYIDCSMKIFISSKQYVKNITVNQIFQYLSEERQLFNGIQATSSLHGQYEYSQKKYAYYMENNAQEKDLKVSFYSQNGKKVLLTAQLLNVRQYQLNLQVKKIAQQQKNKNPKVIQKYNITQKHTIRLGQNQTYGYLYIPKEKLICPIDSSTVSNLCVLSITVQNVQKYQNKQQMSIYSIQINEGISRLELGQTIQDIAKKDNQQNYLIVPITEQHDRIIHISSDSLNNQQCFQTSLLSMDQNFNPNSTKQFTKNNRFILKSNQSQKIPKKYMVSIRFTGQEKENQLPFCHYKISYTKVHKKIYEIQKSVQLQLSYQYSIYYPNSRFTFILYRDNFSEQSTGQSLRAILQYKGVSDINKFKLYSIQMTPDNVANLQKSQIDMTDLLFRLKMSIYNEWDPKSVNISSFDIKNILQEIQSSPSSKYNKIFTQYQNQYSLFLKKDQPKIEQNLTQEEETSQKKSLEQKIKYFLIILQNTAIHDEKYQEGYDDGAFVSKQQKVAITVQDEDQAINLLPQYTVVDRIVGDYSENTSENKDKLKNTTNSSRNTKTYKFNPQIFTQAAPSVNYFDIHFQVIYGHAKIQVLDPDSKSIFTKQINEQLSSLQKLIYQVKYNKMQIKASKTILKIPEYHSKYTIKVSSTNDSPLLYSLQIKNSNEQSKTSSQLLQKIPQTFSMNLFNNKKQNKIEPSARTFIISSFYDEQIFQESSQEITQQTKSQSTDFIHRDNILVFITKQIEILSDKKSKEIFNFKQDISQKLNMKIYFQESPAQASKSQGVMKQITLEEEKIFINDDYCRIQLPGEINGKFFITFSQKNNQETQNSKLNLSIMYYRQKFNQKVNENKNEQSFNQILPIQRDSRQMFPINPSCSYIHMLPFNSLFQIPIQPTTTKLTLKIFLFQTILKEQLPRFFITQSNTESIQQMIEIQQKKTEQNKNIAYSWTFSKGQEEKQFSSITIVFDNIKNLRNKNGFFYLSTEQRQDVNKKLNLPEDTWHHFLLHVITEKSVKSNSSHTQQMHLSYDPKIKNQQNRLIARVIEINQEESEQTIVKQIQNLPQNPLIDPNEPSNVTNEQIIKQLVTTEQETPNVSPDSNSTTQPQPQPQPTQQTQQKQQLAKQLLDQISPSQQKQMLQKYIQVYDKKYHADEKQVIQMQPQDESQFEDDTKIVIQIHFTRQLLTIVLITLIVIIALCLILKRLLRIYRQRKNRRKLNQTQMKQQQFNSSSAGQKDSSSNKKDKKQYNVVLPQSSTSIVKGSELNDLNSDTKDMNNEQGVKKNKQIDL